MDHNILSQWKKSCIKIGTPTTILTAITAFIPIIWLCQTYDCWPGVALVLKAYGLIMLAFGAFCIVEPVSYYAALGISGTYLGFTVGNIANMRLPCANLALEATESEPGSIQGEIVSTISICGSIITNLLFTTLAAFTGATVVAILPEFIVSALTKYAGTAIFGATFASYIMKQPKTAVFALFVPLVLSLTIEPPVWLLIIIAVFGSLILSLVSYQKAANKAD